MSSSHRSHLARVVAALAVLTVGAAGLTACVSRESASSSSEAPALVSTDDLAAVTLDVGDQKGGTEALLRASGELDGTPEVVKFAESLEEACIHVVDSQGIMTKDLAIACGKKDDYVTTGEYLEAVEKRMRTVLSAKL